MPPLLQTGRGELKISLPLPLLRQFKAAIHDPVRGRATYGEAGRIISGLIRQWLRENTQPPSTPKDSPQ